MKKSSSLVIGLGQIGFAIAKVLECDGIDKDQEAPQKSYKFLHICIPYSDDFVKIVKAYQELYTPDYTIIHSTVPLGTSRKCDATHSPCRGVHPKLEEGIRTFIKYFGGVDAYVCSLVFQEKGVTTYHTENQEDTEALKLWDTTQYGKMIMLEKEIYEWCKVNKVDFDLVYTKANEHYNEGYMKLGRHEVVRPYLKHMDGPIGGHCVLPNAKLLGIEL